MAHSAGPAGPSGTNILIPLDDDPHSTDQKPKKAKRASVPKAKDENEGQLGSDGAPRIIRRRKRVLACPICKKMNADASAVHDGDVCKGGHIIINNAQKVWQCQQVFPSFNPI